LQSELVERLRAPWHEWLTQAMASSVAHRAAFALLRRVSSSSSPALLRVVPAVAVASFDGALFIEPRRFFAARPARRRTPVPAGPAAPRPQLKEILRQFWLRVHPDLLMNYPVEKRQNEVERARAAAASLAAKCRPGPPCVRPQESMKTLRDLLEQMKEVDLSWGTGLIPRGVYKMTFHLLPAGKGRLAARQGTVQLVAPSAAAPCRFALPSLRCAQDKVDLVLRFSGGACHGAMERALGEFFERIGLPK
jgi:hypothetical protein